MSKRRISRTTAAIYAFVLVSMQFATRPASADDDGQKAQADRPPLSILVVKLDARSPVVKRLKSMGFEVQEVQWNTIQPSRLMGVDVILLPTGWAYEKNIYETLDGRHEQFQDFVRRGGGLLVCQPNPMGQCKPALLPHPITFRQWYDEENVERIRVGPEHFITQGLDEADLPFPADPMLEVDKHYTVLAMQRSTEWPSLAVCQFGDGRIVVQTANENPGPDGPKIVLPDETLKRMLLWVSLRERDAKQ